MYPARARSGDQGKGVDRRATRAAIITPLHIPEGPACPPPTCRGTASRRPARSTPTCRPPRWSSTPSAARGGQLADSGALVALTGERTARSPEDKYVVRDPAIEAEIDWPATSR